MAVLHGWKWCPRCRGALEGDRRKLVCAECGGAVYGNPATSACALVVDGRGRVLLARRARDPARGRWDAPGGFVEEGESALAALRRELLEETGLEVEPGAFLGGWPDWYGEGPGAPGTLNLYWVATAGHGEPRPADDVSELAWFGPDELPADEEIAFPNVAEVLRAWRKS